MAGRYPLCLSRIADRARRWQPEAGSVEPAPRRRSDRPRPASPTPPVPPWEKPLHRGPVATPARRGAWGTARPCRSRSHSKCHFFKPIEVNAFIVISHMILCHRTYGDQTGMPMASGRHLEKCRAEPTDEVRWVQRMPRRSLSQRKYPRFLAVAVPPALMEFLHHFCV